MDKKVDSPILPSKDHLKILKEKFNINSFKPEQWSAISEIIYEKRDVFINANSGFGKSLIYQYVPVFLGKKSIVISPLISLMETQVNDLESRGIHSSSISGQQKYSIKLPDLKKSSVIYSTPENFQTIRVNIKTAIDNEEIALIAIDEAHCILKSSSDHRQAYTVLRNIKTLFPTVPIVVLASISSKSTTDSICKFLELKNPLVLSTSLNRPNIQYLSLKQSTNFMQDIKPYILDLKKGDGVIIYVFKRTETENYSQVLVREGFDAKFYHSGLIEDIRKETLTDFINGRTNILVTTNSFGMGVHRGNVRIVIHYGIPKNPGTYYIESGRAGRDGLPAKAILFWNEKDFKFHNYYFNQNCKKRIVTGANLALCIDLLSKMKDYATTTTCRRQKLLNSLEEIIPSIITESCCDNCLDTLHKKVGLSKMYKDINSNDYLDISQDVRIVLKMINSYEGRCKNEEIVDYITGNIPTEFNAKHSLEYFGCGLHKPKSWWLYIVKTLKEKRFVERHTSITHTNRENLIEMIVGISREDFIRTTNKGKKFLRLSSLECSIFPRNELYQSLTKSNVEYYIVGDEIKEKSRLSNGCAHNNDSTVFDFSGLSKTLNKNSPRKRLASDSDFSDVSLTELFKSPCRDENFSCDEKSPKIRRLSEINEVQNTTTPGSKPGCSSWCSFNKNAGTESSVNTTNVKE